MMVAEVESVMSQQAGHTCSSAKCWLSCLASTADDSESLQSEIKVTTGIRGVQSALGWPVS